MQRQKTIAKWLAVILLLTVAIACYIALNAVIKNRQADSNIAGADGDQSNTVQPVDPPQPVYTTLPRRAENVGDYVVQHMGGESDEYLLDSVYFANKNLVIFSSLSVQYDVRENGIYIGVVQNDSLIEIRKLCSKEENYVGCIITQRGLLIATSTSHNTVLRLFSSDLKTIAQNSCGKYEQFILYSHASNVYAITYDNVFLQTVSISLSLEISKSNFVCEVSQTTVKEVVAYGEKTLIFLQEANDMKFVVFDQNDGFSVKNELLNNEFAQVLPIFYNGEQLFFTLSYTDENKTVSCYSADFELRNQYVLSSSSPSLLLPYDGGVAVFDGEQIHTFCAHLDLLSSTDCATKNEFEGYTFEIVNGRTNMFFAKDKNTLKVCLLQDKNIITAFECVCDVQQVFLEKRPSSTQEENFDCTLIFAASSANYFGYMCFGQLDVFMVGMQLS